MIELGASTLKLQHDRLLEKYFTKQSTLNEDIIKIEIMNNYNTDVSFKDRNTPAFYRCYNLPLNGSPNIVPIIEIVFEEKILNELFAIKNNVYFPVPDHGMIIT